VYGIVSFINLVFNILILLVVARAILSWLPVPPYHPTVRMLDSLTEPLLRPFRKMGRTAAGGFDFSPMILILVLIVAQRVLLGLLAR
jgi:YggT family protein